VCIRFVQRILRGDEVLVEANVRVACLGAANFRPTRLPAAIANALSNAMSGITAAATTNAEAHAGAMKEPT
jgi:acyl-CoA thioesterase FadM